MHTVDFAPALRRLAGVVDFARGERHSADGFLVARDRAATTLWQEVYPRLNADRLGAAGQAITSSFKSTATTSASIRSMPISRYARSSRTTR